jgi:DNA-binding response OmpR family regulator
MLEVQKLAPEVKPLPATRKNFVAPRSSGRSLVVVAGRHPDTRFMLRSLLELWNYDVAEATGPEESVRIAEADRPAAVLIDGYLPMADCLAEVERLKQSASMNGVPVVVLSGFSKERVGPGLAKSGADGLMTKPLDFDALERLLRYFSNGGF